MIKSPLGATDLSQWRLDSGDAGRHVWHYVRAPGEAGSRLGYEEVWGADERGVKDRQQTEEEKYWLGLPLPQVEVSTAPSTTPLAAARRGYEFYKRIQAPDGHWSGEYGGTPASALFRWPS